VIVFQTGNSDRLATPIAGSFPPAFSEMSELRVPARAGSAEDLTEFATVGLVGRRSIRKITIKHNPLPDWQIW
jgi:hypothetical protein